ncbi:hypothetical protein RA20_01050 [Leisingera sp. ANG-Vp]|nr:hypothetical protein RA20_01050 [Leisingera sp. ANG-Vp]
MNDFIALFRQEIHNLCEHFVVQAIDKGSYIVFISRFIKRRFFFKLGVVFRWNARLDLFR